MDVSHQNGAVNNRKSQIPVQFKQYATDFDNTHFVPSCDCTLAFPEGSLQFRVFIQFDNPP